MSDFRNLTDLAARRSGSGVILANDEFFAEKESLLNEGRAGFQSHTFGHKGQIYDGWETRRRRDEGNDWAIIRLGNAGVVHGVVIDTGNFTGNYPEFASVEAAAFDGNPSSADVAQAEWKTILPKSALTGDSENLFEISDKNRWTHIRLSIYPDGGVARFRVHGVVIPDPRWVLARGVIDLAGIENGGELTGCSDAFYSSARNCLQPGLARSQGDGWENKRRRHGGNDWFSVSLACEGRVRAIEVDTTHFKGNAPGQIMVTGSGRELVSKQDVQPDTPHRFIVEEGSPISEVRLDVYPDGGLGRFRVWGEPTENGMRDLAKKWWNSLPQKPSHAPSDLKKFL